MNQKEKFIENRTVVARGEGDWKVGKMGEGDQEIETSSHKINKACDVTYSMLAIVNNILVQI